MVGKTKPATKAEKARFEAIKALGCIACRKLCVPIVCGPTEAHHLLSGGRRRGHDAVIPLGSWHHRSVIWYSLNRQQMEATFGPSLANGSKRFHATFGSDDALLAEVNALIEGRA